MPSNTGLRGELGFTRIDAELQSRARASCAAPGIDETRLELGHTWRPSGGVVPRPCSRASMPRRIDIPRRRHGAESEHQRAGHQRRLQLAGRHSASTSRTRRKACALPFTISRGVTIPEGTYSLQTTSTYRCARATNARSAADCSSTTATSTTAQRFGATTFIGWREPALPRQSELSVQRGFVSRAKAPSCSRTGCRAASTLDCEFITRVVRLSLETIFSSRLSWVNLIQYDNVSHTVGLNSRLHWIPQAGREGFLVLNHNVRDDPLTPG